MLQLPVSDPTVHQLLREQIAASQQTNKLLAQLVRIQLGTLNLLHSEFVQPKRPRLCAIIPVGEMHMGAEDRQKFEVSLQPLSPPHDVVLRKLWVKAGDGEIGKYSVVPGAGPDAFPLIDVPEGSVVMLTFIDSDDAVPPNDSKPLVYEFVAGDTTPPNQPAGLSVVPAGEVPGTVPAPVPEPETPSTPE